MGKTLDHIRTIQKLLKSRAKQNDSDGHEYMISTSAICKSVGFGSWLLLDALQWVHILLF